MCAFILVSGSYFGDGVLMFLRVPPELRRGLVGLSER